MIGTTIRRSWTTLGGARRRGRTTLERQLIDTGGRLAAAGLVRGRSGNLSARDGRGMRITAAGSRLGTLRPADLLALPDLAGVRPEASPPSGRRPSSELALHAAIYRERPDVSAIVHTHSPYATAWACVRAQLDLMLEEAAYYDMGSLVHVAPYAPAGSLRLAHLTVRALAGRAAVLLERHGAVAVGPDLATALEIAESLEHQAQVAWLLETGGDAVRSAGSAARTAAADLVSRTRSA